MKLNDTILEVMRHIRNYFHFNDTANKPHHLQRGTFEITDGNIELDAFFEVGDWICITESRRNNGIYLLADAPPLEAPPTPSDLPLFRLANGTDKENPLDGVKSLTGAICALMLPAGFLTVCKEINQYMSNPENFPGPKTGENVIGFYSWTKATGQDGKPLTAFQVFADKLEPWRRMFTAFEL